MAPGAGFEPAHDRINSAAPSQLGYPGRTMVGNLGVGPSGSAIRTQWNAVFLAPETRKSLLPAHPDSNRNLNLRRAGPCPVGPWTRINLGWPEEIESSWTVPQTAAYPLGHGHTWCQQRLANLVEEEGIEPPSAGCRPAVLPLNDSPNFFGARGGSRNPNLRFTKAALVRLSYSGT